jgi:hypothetical protein
LASPNRLYVTVVTPDLQLIRRDRHSTLFRIRANSAPLVLVMTHPTMESEALPTQSRRSIQSHQRAFQQERS